MSTVHFRVPFYGLYRRETRTTKEAHSHRMIQVGNANRLTIHTGKCAVCKTAHLASSRIVTIKEIWRFYLDRILLEDTFFLFKQSNFSVQFSVAVPSPVWVHVGGIHHCKYNAETFVCQVIFIPK